MLSFEEDFQDVCMLPRSARKVSQVLNSFLISSSQFCFYLFAVATITHRDTFLSVDIICILDAFVPHGHNSKTDQRKQYCAGLMFFLSFGKMENSQFHHLLCDWI